MSKFDNNANHWHMCDYTFPLKFRAMKHKINNGVDICPTYLDD